MSKMPLFTSQEHFVSEKKVGAYLQEQLGLIEGLLANCSTMKVHIRMAYPEAYQRNQRAKA